MQKKINWVQWLVLPLIFTACGGRESNQAATLPSDQPAQKHSASQQPVKVVGTDHSGSNHHSETVDHSHHAESDHHSGTVDHSHHSESEHHSETADHSHHLESDHHSGTVEHVGHTETADHTELKTPISIPKTEITEDLKAQVKAAKEVRDNVGLPPGYRAVYNIYSEKGEETVKVVEVPEENSMEYNPYYLNASEVFPQGMSLGMIKTSITEDGQEAPHTEERFMSYQQFYSGISGTYRDIVYFGDEAEQQEPHFFFDLPDGLLTTAEQLPTAGQATYQGKAIDGERFGDFRYEVDFASKEGYGKISWQETKEGQLGDIVLQTGNIAEQLLSVYPEPEDFPPNYSQRGPGVQGVATIKGHGDKSYQYQALFFGPKAEELTGLVYEVKESEHTHEHLHSHDHGMIIDHHADTGHHHEVEKINVTAFSGER